VVANDSGRSSFTAVCGGDSVIRRLDDPEDGWLTVLTCPGARSICPASSPRRAIQAASPLRLAGFC
jgi:hypothetical protein